jgi:hypothetical protein
VPSALGAAVVEFTYPLLDYTFPVAGEFFVGFQWYYLVCVIVDFLDVVEFRHSKSSVTLALIL